MLSLSRRRAELSPMANHPVSMTVVLCISAATLKGAEQSRAVEINRGSAATTTFCYDDSLCGNTTISCDDSLFTIAATCTDNFWTQWRTSTNEWLESNPHPWHCLRLTDWWLLVTLCNKRNRETPSSHWLSHIAKGWQRGTPPIVVQ